MDNATIYQRHRATAARVLAVFCFLLVFFWFMVPDTLPSSFPEANVDVPLPSPVNDRVAEVPVQSGNCRNPNNKPLQQYALMIDAGSTGSRIHVYNFSNCNETPDFENESFKQIKPGLSSYGDDPAKAAASLDALMQVAMEKVPEQLRRCTPVAVKATAGLRLLGPQKSQRILDAVRSHLETKYPFPLAGVSVMDGSDEGVYAWITVNYLLGKFGNGPSASPKESSSAGTVAVFDLGGASTQIVFEPSFGAKGGHKDGHKIQGEHRYALQFGGRNYELYQNSYLGYGLMEARKKIENHVALGSRLSEEIDDFDETEDFASIVHPCFPPGHIETLLLNDTNTVKLHSGPGAPSYAQCLTLAETILDKNASCPLLPCSFAGTHQPSLTNTFSNEIYAFSYFYDRTAPLGMPSEFSLRDLRTLTQQVCSTRPTDHLSHIPDVDDVLEAEPLWCMDLSFIYSLLRFGYDIPEDRVIRIAKQIRNAETGWCLGAAMTMIDEASLCVLE